MKTVTLVTANGSFVHRGQIPPFLDGHDPEFIVWGDRGFVLDSRSHGLIYRECFWYPLVDRVEQGQEVKE